MIAEISKVSVVGVILSVTRQTGRLQAGCSMQSRGTAVES